jgi:hypothetical protein
MLVGLVQLRVVSPDVIKHNRRRPCSIDLGPIGQYQARQQGGHNSHRGVFSNQVQAVVCTVQLARVTS